MVFIRWSGLCIVSWLACYIAIVLHAFSLMTIDYVAVDLVALPSLGALAFGVFKYKVSTENPEDIQEELDRLGKASGFIAAFDWILITPIIVSGFVIVIAQFQSSYEAVGWWVVVLGLISGGEIGSWLRYRT